MAIKTPKLAFPFQRGSYHEQGSDDEIFDCIEVLLSTELGEREEVPDYGVPDQAFRQNGADIGAILEVVDEWEPRAAVSIQREALEDFVDQLTVKVSGGQK